MTPTIVRKETITQEDLLAVTKPLQQFNLETGPPLGHIPVLLHVVDPEGNPTGGLFGQIFYDWLHIEYLVVPESLRSTGVGTQLMLQAEQIAAEAKCIGVYVDTLGFQARPFYEKLGYTVYGQLEDHPRGHTHYFLQKRLR